MTDAEHEPYHAWLRENIHIAIQPTYWLYLLPPDYMEPRDDDTAHIRPVASIGDGVRPRSWYDEHGGRPTLGTDSPLSLRG